jgi:hypothetical protein
VELRHRAAAKRNLRVPRTDQVVAAGDSADPSAVPASTAEKNPPRRPSGAWVSSSWDLLRGCEVTEISDSLPDGLLDELFRPHAETPKKPEK